MLEEGPKYNSDGKLKPQIAISNKPYVLVFIKKNRRSYCLGGLLSHRPFEDPNSSWSPIYELIAA